MSRLNRMLPKPWWRLTHKLLTLRIRDTLKNEEVRPVSVAHELSSEIAAAILARKEETPKLEELKEVVLRVHSTLQKLTMQCREQNRNRRLVRSQPGNKSQVS